MRSRTQASCLGLQPCGLGFELYREFGPLAQFAVDGNRSVMKLDDPLGEIEAESMPAARADLLAAGAIVFLEHPLAVLRRDADALVADADLHLVLGQLFRIQNYPAAGTAVLDRVVQQVVDGDAEQVLVQPRRTQVRRDLQLDLHLPRPRALAHAVHDLLQQVLNLHPLALDGQGAGFQLGNVKEIIDQVSRPLDLAVYGVHRFHAVLIGELAVTEKQLAEGRDGGERRLELVRNLGDELGARLPGEMLFADVAERDQHAIHDRAVARRKQRVGRYGNSAIGLSLRGIFDGGGVNGRDDLVLEARQQREHFKDQIVPAV